MLTLLRTTVAALALGAIGSFGAAPAPAADFSGETIEWTVPFGVGGGTDVWARFFAPQLTQKLPGQPTVVVLNVPGGGSITGANQFHARAEPDGLSILGTSASTQFPFMLGDPRVRYDYADWVPILASPTGGVVYVQSSLGVNGPADLERLKGQELRFGSQGATQLEMVALLAFKQLGLNVKPVFGMQSRGEGRLAFERGEAGIDFQTTSAYLTNVKPLIAAGKAVPLFSLGVIDDAGELQRDPSFPELPHFVEFYTAAMGEPPAGEAFEAWRAFLIAGFSLQKMIVLPKDVPADVLAAYRQAVSEIVSAPDFHERAGEEIGIYDQAVGEEAERQLREALDLDPAVRQWVRDWLATDYGTSF
ncbi:MAG TPA: hypothetical protein VFG43_03805 [Geminicoccaceae bacterium]|nr:hypothetical protein [Geminicoccaceae bacterium]